MNAEGIKQGLEGLFGERQRSQKASQLAVPQDKRHEIQSAVLEIDGYRLSVLHAGKIGRFSLSLHKDLRARIGLRSHGTVLWIDVRLGAHANSSLEQKTGFKLSEPCKASGTRSTWHLSTPDARYLNIIQPHPSNPSHCAIIDALIPNSHCSPLCKAPSHI